MSESAMKAVFAIEARKTPWRLVIEPWAVSFDVSADVPVAVEIDVLEGELNINLDADEKMTFLAFWDPSFRVRIGDQEEAFNFPKVERG